MKFSAIRLLRPVWLAGLTLCIALYAQTVQARIIRIEITGTDSPTYSGRTFGNVGAYEKLRGRAYGEVDPKLPENALITDIQLAPRNAKGMAEYAIDIYILKPVDLRKGNHRLVMDVPNRGASHIGDINDSHGINDAGEGFLLKRGYTIAGGAWDISAPHREDLLTIDVPVARNPDGSSITGPSYEYISFDTEKVGYTLTYSAASLDTSKATLTVREHLNNPPQIVPADKWEYVGDRKIQLLPSGTPFRQSAIYELRYIAKDPLVAGLGLAAMRDLVSFLRYAKADDNGTANPLAGDVKYTFSFTESQPARFMNDYEALGFNRDEQGRQVLDGMENWVGGGSGGNINYRFAQPDRTERNRQNHLYPEGVFPFAYPVLSDKLTGKTAGRSERCTTTHTCAKVLDINSANEYWVKGASLLHTDLAGNDLPDPENVRFYLISTMQHGGGNESRGVCQQLHNPTNGDTALRALFLALDAWVSNGTAPPPSMVPRKADGTAVFATVTPGALTGVVPQAALGWPAIPGVTYNGLITTRYALDWGASFSEGVISNLPTSFDADHAYPTFVSKVDADGNEIAGIRLPPVAAPVATLSGWGLRREGFAENDGCESSGQSIPFRKTRKERMAAGDPRPSLEERYKTHEGYVVAVAKAAKDLQAKRLLLPEDVERYIEQAEKSDVLR
jgi:Alpha/beta hydrolase domain